MDQGGPTLWPMEGSDVGYERAVRRVSAVQNNELHAWYLVHVYPGTAVYVFFISRHHLVRGQLLVLTGRPGSHGQSSGKIFAAKLFGGMLECLRGSS